MEERVQPSTRNHLIHAALHGRKVDRIAPNGQVLFCPLVAENSDAAPSAAGVGRLRAAPGVVAQPLSPPPPPLSCSTFVYTCIAFALVDVAERVLTGPLCTLAAMAVATWFAH